MNEEKNAYIKTKEDKSRRKVLKPIKRHKVTVGSDNSGRIVNLWSSASRQTFNTFVRFGSNIKKNIRRNLMTYGIGILLISIWYSGFLAHAGMKFESLLALVAGVIIATVIASLSGKK